MFVSDNRQSHTHHGSESRNFSVRRVAFNEKEIMLDGHNLDIKSVVAVARSRAVVQVDAKVNHNMEESVRLLKAELDRSSAIYGVSTGFGGSADTRTNKYEELQATLIRELHAGILSSSSRIEPFHNCSPGCFPTSCPSANLDARSGTCMPEAWVRASILIRINSLASGRSAVRSILIHNMMELLRQNIIPRIPLRGSISASGDLMPLSYLGGTIEGKDNITVWTGSEGNRRIVSAAVALSEAGIVPIKLGPKEGLAIINGTAVSTGVGTLALHDANSLAIISQILTAMSVEALRGTAESFDSFFDIVRPHPGQRMVATTIRRLLAGSRLTQINDGSVAGSLRQDGYSIRTAPQWLGPVLEDLKLASQQMTIECNSVTDNPLIEISPTHPMNSRILHGGNFQAKVVTSAMEKTRQALQTMGQMLFAQCTEIINPKMNCGLTPNLTADEPSESFLFKPIDITIAALQSELGFLSNPVGTHVQSAEMGNQSLNSLALISARYTHSALEVLLHLAACHLFALCQALDLRAMHARFLEALEPIFMKIMSNTLKPVLVEKTTANASFKHVRKRALDKVESQEFLTGHPVHTIDISDPSIIRSSSPPRKKRKSSSPPTRNPVPPVESSEDLSSADPFKSLHSLLWTGFLERLDQTTSIDSSLRFPSIFKSLQPIVIDFTAPPSSSPLILSAIKDWTQAISAATLTTFRENRDSYHANLADTSFLGRGSQAMYRFVRDDLDVPFLCTSMLKHGKENGATQIGNGTTSALGNNKEDEEGPRKEIRCNLTTGELITRIYEALRDDRLLSCPDVASLLASENGDTIY